jgi:hypothetical protein
MNENNKTELNKWIMKPQESDGTYRFDGVMYGTSGIAHNLGRDDLQYIIKTVKQYVKTNNGADFIFVFENEYLDKRIFVIDKLNDYMKLNNDADYVNENNYYTIMFADEY